MKPSIFRKTFLVLVAILLVLGSLSLPSSTVAALSGSAVATATPSDTAPDLGEKITVTVSINMTGVNAPDNLLGAYTGSLQWNPAVLSYASHSGAPPAGFTGAVGTTNTGTGSIAFNGANASGAAGTTTAITVTFNVIGVGSAGLNLDFSAMSAATTFANLLSVLTVIEASVAVPGGTTGTVEVDGNASSGTANGVSTISFSHTTGTGENRLTLVGVSWNCGGDRRTISSVVFGTLPLTEVKTQEVTGTGDPTGPRFAAIYKLVNPPDGETGTITVTFSGNVSNGIVAGAANFQGVDQTTPLGTVVGAGESDSTPTVSTGELTAKHMVFDTLFMGFVESSAEDIVPGAGQTSLWNKNIGNARGGASYERPASPVTMSWTDTAYSWALAAVPINPAIPISHTVTFNANGGTGSMAQQVANTPTALTANTFTRSNYIFTGWNTAADGSGIAYANSAIYSFAADVTLYAQWQASEPGPATIKLFLPLITR